MANNKQAQAEMERQSQKLEKVIKSLEKVNSETKQMIYNMATQMSELEVIQSFNQNSQDFFNLSTSITRKMGKEGKLKMAGYGALFDNAIKINVKMPIDHYTLIVLEFAAEIYEGNENFFLKKEMNEAVIEVGNEFSMIRSDGFKELWIVLNDEDKNAIKEKMLLLTTFAHVYFYQTILKYR